MIKQSIQKQIRRGTADEHNAFVGAIGEVTMDTTNNTLRVHDGITAGGTMLAKQSTLDTADYVVESQLPTAENNYTWYRKYKSGWVEQGGKSATPAAKAGVRVNFPVAMTMVGHNNVCFGIQGAWNDAAILYTVRTLIQDNTGMTCVGVQHLGSTTGYQAVSFFWRVSGMAQ